MNPDLVNKALNAAATVLEYDVDSCCDCNYGEGATGKTSEGNPCEECQEVRVALDLVHAALASADTSGGNHG